MTWYIDVNIYSPPTYSMTLSIKHSVVSCNFPAIGNSGNANVTNNLNRWQIFEAISFFKLTVCIVNFIDKTFISVSCHEIEKLYFMFPWVCYIIGTYRYKYTVCMYMYIIRWEDWIIFSFIQRILKMSFFFYFFALSPYIYFPLLPYRWKFKLNCSNLNVNWKRV